ncbi:MAG: hypothetical protein AAF565_08180, partial [Pseudomonadota bacterium]
MNRTFGRSEGLDPVDAVHSARFDEPYPAASDPEPAGFAVEPEDPMPNREARREILDRQSGLLWDMQKDDGHIVFELEADCTIPAEYVLLRHFLGEIDAEREGRIAKYIRGIQNEDGSWPLFHAGSGNISATVKGYWALKLIGDDVDAPHMARARRWVLSQGGAAKANVFTRIMMALYREIPWRGM